MGSTGAMHFAATQGVNDPRMFCAAMLPCAGTGRHVLPDGVTKTI